MKVLLLSAYAARSHVYWQQALEAMFPQCAWTVLSLPPRHFSWRVRGNALYWSMAEREVLERPYDLLIATSMVDLATLRGLVPALSVLRSVVYFHENQFEYPQHKQEHSLLDAQVTSIYTALSADSLVFNSSYNLDSFMAGCDALLAKLPDRIPGGVVTALQAKAVVLPVPIDSAQLSSVSPRWPGNPPASGPGPLRLLWVGRFEHDKGGEGLLHILQQLERVGLDYELAVTGQQFRNSPTVFGEIQSAFSHRIVQFGYVESVSEYRSLLGAAELVLSTALHEFQGLAVMEAVAAGCVPVVPDRLGYREIYDSQFRYISCGDDPDREAESAAELIQQLARALRAGSATALDISAFDQLSLRSRYAQLLQIPMGPHDSH